MLYAVIHKNKEVIGPHTWSQKSFTDILKIRHRVQANIPYQPPEEMPYIINEDTRIHEIEERRPDFDPMVEYLEGPQWDLSNDIAIAQYTVQKQPIEAARNNFRSIAAAE